MREHFLAAFYYFAPASLLAMFLFGQFRRRHVFRDWVVYLPYFHEIAKAEIVEGFGLRHEILVGHF
jgi:hypothetical protein